MTEPPTTRRRSKRTPRFQAQFAKLQKKDQDAAKDLFKVFAADPHDPVLGTKRAYDTKKGRHRPGSYSVRVSIHYRALYVIDNGENGDGPEQYCWYWVGTREDYGTFIGCR